MLLPLLCRMRRVTMYLTTATAKLQNFKEWERRYCADMDKAYKVPEEKQPQQQQQQQQAGGGQQQPRQRMPPLRRPVEHPMWVNKRFTEVRCRKLHPFIVYWARWGGVGGAG
jgi:hypothetical protein